MESAILELLYFGGSVSERTQPSEEYERLQVKLMDKQSELQKLLDENGLKILKEMIKLVTDMESEACSSLFIEGVRAGARLMIEILGGC